MIWIDLSVAFSVGLLGSIHCIGMCGGIVAALSLGSGQSEWRGLFYYHAGRITVYSLLGLLIGLAGKAFVLKATFLPIQQTLSLVAGLFIILFSLQIGGFIPEKYLNLTAFRIPGSLLKKAAKGRPFYWGVAGMANGLLPCGMVYAALALALKQAAPLDAALVMTAFGAGTLPAMAGFTAALSRWSPDLRSRFLKLTACLMVLFGLFTLYRGISPPHHRGEMKDGHGAEVHGRH